MFSKKILVHTCCAPCLSFINKRLKDKFEIVVYFYNPNIQPFQEYKRRKIALQEFCKLNSIELIIDERDYEFEKWFDYIYFQGKNTFSELKKSKKIRCQSCYRMRLIETIKKAKALDIKNWTTTLLYSIYQYHEYLKIFCENIEKEDSRLKFYYEDFRKGWQEGFEIYKKTNLYRQNYCGCIFSENERFNRINNI
ncbi:MAG: epoxyqueuosine reductase QueH [Elusimicrobiota bacterium]|nr:epoxyqueuosine reductase QueH [Elusimicrobiota bacterium]